MQWWETTNSHWIDMLLNVIGLFWRRLIILICHGGSYWVNTIYKWCLCAHNIFPFFNQFSLSCKIVVTLKVCLLFLDVLRSHRWILVLHIAMKLFILVYLVQWMTPRELIILSIFNWVIFYFSCWFINRFWVLSKQLLPRRILFKLFVTLAGLHSLIEALSTLRLSCLWSFLMLWRDLILLLRDSPIGCGHWCLHALPDNKANVDQLVLSLDDHVEGRLAFIEAPSAENWLISYCSLQVVTRLPSILRGRISLRDNACFVNIWGEHLVEGDDAIVALEV